MLASAASGEARGLFSPWRIYCRSAKKSRRQARRSENVFLYFARRRRTGAELHGWNLLL
jgi:hypothetical protein